MVVGHDHVDTGSARGRDLLDRGDRAVDGHQQAGAARGEALDGGRREPVAIVDPARQVPVDIGTERSQRADQHGGRTDAVDVVVAVHGDARAAFDMGENPRGALAQAAERVERMPHVRVDERPRGRGIAEPAADEHLCRDVRHAECLAQALRGGEVVRRDLQASLGRRHSRTVRAGQDGTGPAAPSGGEPARPRDELVTGRHGSVAR